MFKQNILLEQKIFLEEFYCPTYQFDVQLSHQSLHTFVRINYPLPYEVPRTNANDKTNVQNHVSPQVFKESSI